MSFLADKEVGEEFERHVIEFFHNTFGIRFEKNPNRKGVDLICGPPDKPLLSCEVKWDRRVKETGNTFIEIYSEGKIPHSSGLFASFDFPPYFFVIGCEGETLVFHTEKLKEKVYEWKEESTFRMCNAGDGWRSKGMIVPWEALQDEALYSFK